MICGFVAKTIDTGGAQKMMAFLINTLSSCADKIYLFLEQQQDTQYHLPNNAEIVLLKTTIKAGKVTHLKSIVSDLHNQIIKYNLNSISAFGAYYSLAAVLAAKKTNAKIICSERRSPCNLSFVWRVLSRYAYKRCDKVVFQLEDAASFYRGINKENKAIIPNPYLSDFEYVTPSAIKRRKVICLAAARLEYEKGFDLGLSALKHVIEVHPEYDIYVYGCGDIHQYDSIMDEPCFAKHVIFKGLSQNIISDILSCSVFVLPSRNEGIPNMLLEAMGAGIPCVAFDCPPGGPKLLIGQNNERGLLVPAQNVSELTKAVLMILENENLSNEISNNAQLVKTIFEQSTIQKLWIDLFKKCIGNIK